LKNHISSTSLHNYTLEFRTRYMSFYFYFTCLESL